MDFTYQGIKYYIHWWYKDYYKSAFYVYYKDGELVYIDYTSSTLSECVECFKKVVLHKNIMYR